MRLRSCLLLILWLLLGVAGVANPTWAGHLVISASDGKYPQVDGAYKIADPPEPDILMILDVSKFPPRVVAEIEVMHGTPGPPTGVALTPDEKLGACLSNVSREKSTS